MSVFETATFSQSGALTVWTTMLCQRWRSASVSINQPISLAIPRLFILSSPLDAFLTARALRASSQNIKKKQFLFVFTTFHATMRVIKSLKTASSSFLHLAYWNAIEISATEQSRSTATESEIVPQLRASLMSFFLFKWDNIEKCAITYAYHRPRADCWECVITLRPRHHREKNTSWYRRATRRIKRTTPRRDWLHRAGFEVVPKICLPPPNQRISLCRDDTKGRLRLDAERRLHRVHRVALHPGNVYSISSSRVRPPFFFFIWFICGCRNTFRKSIGGLIIYYLAVMRNLF